MLFYKEADKTTGRSRWRVTQMAYVYLLAGFAALTPLVAFEGDGGDERWWHFVWAGAVLLCVYAAYVLNPAEGQECACGDDTLEE